MAGTVLQTAGRASSKVFLSAELTGNGSSQSTPHGLGRIPTIVLVIPQGGGAASITYGTPDATNVKATVSNGAKYRVLAIESV